MKKKILRWGIGAGKQPKYLAIFSWGTLKSAQKVKKSENFSKKNFEKKFGPKSDPRWAKKGEVEGKREKKGCGGVKEKKNRRNTQRFSAGGR